MNPTKVIHIYLFFYPRYRYHLPNINIQLPSIYRGGGKLGGGIGKEEVATALPAYQSAHVSHISTNLPTPPSPHHHQRKSLKPSQTLPPPQPSNPHTPHPPNPHTTLKPPESPKPHPPNPPKTQPSSKKREQEFSKTQAQSLHTFIP